MNYSTIKLSLCAATLLGGSLLFNVGCEEDRHPVPMTSRTDSTSETGMTEPVALDQLNPMIDDAAQYLVREMPNIPAVQASKNQMVFSIPPDLDHDARFNDGRLREALAALRSKLQESETFKNNFVVITGTTGEANKNLAAVGGDSTAFRDPLQRHADTTHAETYDPSSIYLLTGKFYQANDPGPGLKDYRLMIYVTAARDRQQVLKYEFHRELKWDSKRGKWKELES